VGADVDLTTVPPTGVFVSQPVIPTGPITIMFDKSGRFKHVKIGTFTSSSPVYLLITNERKPVFGNLLDGISKGVSGSWVTLSRKRVSTTENLGIVANAADLTINNSTPYGSQADFLAAAVELSRAFARSGPSQGGL
jgi:hypothetical protein